MRGRRGILLIVGAIGATALPSPAAWASFPGDNGLIAVTHFTGPLDSEIYVMRPDGTARTPLTSSPFGNQQPSWSADGQRIAFASSRGATSYPAPRAGEPSPSLMASIFTMHADGSHQTALTGLAPPGTPPDQYTNYHTAAPTWSSDSRQLAYDSNGPFGDANIWTMSALTGSGERPLIFNPDRVLDEEPDWAPDGNFIAFARMDGTGDPTCAHCRFHLFTLNPLTRATTQLTSGDGMEEYPEYSPDSRSLAFVSSSGPADPTFSLEVMSATPGAGPRVLVNDVRESRPAWSPDGHEIAFARASGGIAVVSISGGPARVIDSDSGDSDPSWQPLRTTPPHANRLPPPICSQQCLRDFRLRRLPDDVPLHPGEALPLELYCPAPSQLAAAHASTHVRGCRGTASLSQGRAQLATARFASAGGRFITVRLRLSRAAAHLQKTGAKLSVAIRFALPHVPVQRRTFVLLRQPSISIRCGGTATAGSPHGVSGSLHGVSGTARLTIVYESAGGGRIASEEATIAKGGSFAGRFSPEFPGTLLALAMYGGSSRYEPATSRTCPIRVTSPPPPPGPVQESITATCPGSGSVGGQVPVTGTLSPAVAGATVELDIAGPGGATATQVATVGPSGAFATSYVPSAQGNWTVVVRYGGDAGHTAASSIACTTLASEAISIACDATGSVGVPVGFSGTLTPPVAGQPVSISIEAPDGTTSFESVSDGASGSFSGQYTPTATGTWTVTAVYSNDDGQFTVSSPPCATTVQK